MEQTQPNLKILGKHCFGHYRVLESLVFSKRISFSRFIFKLINRYNCRYFLITYIMRQTMKVYIEKRFSFRVYISINSSNLSNQVVIHINDPKQMEILPQTKGKQICSSEVASRNNIRAYINLLAP